MKKLLIICALFLSINAVKADEVITVHLNDSAPKTFAITDATKITFDAEGINIFYPDTYCGTDGEVIEYSVRYTDINKITFDEGVGMESIIATNTSVVLAPNPTKNYLVINNGDNLYGSDLYIYSITGTLMSKQTKWNGERIDVSSLNAGVYFISVGSTTAKFIKQ